MIFGTAKCILMFFFALNVDSFLNEQETLWIMLNMLVISTFSAIESIAVDAWVLTLLPEH